MGIYIHFKKYLPTTLTDAHGKLYRLYDMYESLCLCTCKYNLDYIMHAYVYHMYQINIK